MIAFDLLVIFYLMLFYAPWTNMDYCSMDLNVLVVSVSKCALVTKMSL